MINPNRRREILKECEGMSNIKLRENLVASRMKQEEQAVEIVDLWVAIRSLTKRLKKFGEMNAMKNHYRDVIKNMGDFYARDKKLWDRHNNSHIDHISTLQNDKEDTKRLHEKQVGLLDEINTHLKAEIKKLNELLDIARLDAKANDAIIEQQKGDLEAIEEVLRSKKLFKIKAIKHILGE